MLGQSLLLVLAALAVPLVVAASNVQLDSATHHRLLLSGSPKVGLWQSLLKQAEKQVDEQALMRAEDGQHTFSTSSKPKYEAYCFDQPISHFDKSINGTFCHRYWMDASSYKEGGPVFVLDGGETSGADRLPFLEKGILQILANATNGLSIVLEHRYYGKSLPVSSFSTDDLRFLNNAEALEDSAYFIENFKPPKSLLPLASESSLHPSNTPWIYYGGSYAGARAAHMRVQYPHLVWGAIASSAVTHAQVEMPEYMNPIMKYGPPECISALEKAISAIDTLLALPEPVPTVVKGLFGLEKITDNGDFADVLESPLGYWQGKNWDAAIGSQGFYQFCDALTAGGAGSKIGLVKIPAEVMNYAKYIKENVVSECPPDESGSPDVISCFSSTDDSQFLKDDLKQTWRLWIFQVCTQWGYFQIAPSEGPSIVSRHATLEHKSKICRQAFPPGKYMTVPPLPDVEEVNARGDFAIDADRLAFIDGDRDPWRPCTPQSDYALPRKSTVNKPVYLIFDGVHHYDENGLSDHSLEPKRIQDVHGFEVNFVQEWLAQWKEHNAKGLSSSLAN